MKYLLVLLLSIGFVGIANAQIDPEDTAFTNPFLRGLISSMHLDSSKPLTKHALHLMVLDYQYLEIERQIDSVKDTATKIISGMSGTLYPILSSPYSYLVNTTPKPDTARILMLIADTSRGVSHNVFYLRGYEVYAPFQIGRYFIADGNGKMIPLPLSFVIFQTFILNYF